MLTYTGEPEIVTTYDDDDDDDDDHDDHDHDHDDHDDDKEDASLTQPRHSKYPVCLRNNHTLKKTF